MSNSDYNGKVINLDTFTDALTVPSVKIHSIEWVKPEDVGDECLVKLNNNDGVKVINWVCSTQFKNEIKYFDGQVITLYIPAGGVESGELIIYLR